MREEKETRILIVTHRGDPARNYTGGDYDFGFYLDPLAGGFRIRYWTSASNDFPWCDACGEFHDPKECWEGHEIVPPYRGVAEVDVSGR